MPLLRSATPVALLRCAAGAALLARPGILPRIAGVDSASAARTQWVGQMLGARELALGAGALAARGGSSEERRRWLLAALLADSADVAVVLGAARARRVSPRGAALLAGVAALAVAGQARAARSSA